jgi:hypothetical protein
MRFFADIYRSFYLMRPEWRHERHEHEHHVAHLDLPGDPLANPGPDSRHECGVERKHRRCERSLAFGCCIDTLENRQTGIRFTTATNETGVYQFPSVPPGLYRLTGERPGFQTIRYGDLVLEVSAPITHNLVMKVADVKEIVEVTADLNSPLAATTPSIGGVINGIRVSDLPLPDRNTLGLVDTQAGIVRSPSNNGIADHLGGARRLAVNVTRDGINVHAPGRKCRREFGGLSERGPGGRSPRRDVTR